MEDIKKVTVNDLRLGNYLYYTECTECTEETIKTPLQVECLSKDYIWLNHDNVKFGNVVVDTEYLEPIPLSGELLELLGFGKRKMYGYNEHFVYSYMNNKNFEITALFGCDFSISIGDNAKKVTYLHELQNIFYMFKSKELEIDYSVIESLNK